MHNETILALVHRSRIRFTSCQKTANLRAGMPYEMQDWRPSVQPSKHSHPPARDIARTSITAGLCRPSRRDAEQRAYLQRRFPPRPDGGMQKAGPALIPRDTRTTAWSAAACLLPRRHASMSRRHPTPRDQTAVHRLPFVSRCRCWRAGGEVRGRVPLRRPSTLLAV